MININDYLSELSENLNITPSLKNKIDISIEALRKNLWGYFQDRLQEVILFGSYDRETIVISDPNADVDVIVVFKQKEVLPDTYLKQLKEFCEKYYPNSQVYRSYPTIVLDMNHIKFEIMPSYYVSDDTKKIPAPRSNEFNWISTYPKAFRNKLNTKNSNNKSLIKPVIKIYKYLNYTKGYPFSSYSIEDTIINKSYECSSMRDYFFWAGNAIISSSKSQTQKEFTDLLKEKIRRLRALERENLAEYIELEMQSFLPRL